MRLLFGPIYPPGLMSRYRGESVTQLQRAVYAGKVAPEHGRRRDELGAISGAHALLTNIVLAWTPFECTSGRAAQASYRAALCCFCLKRLATARSRPSD